MQQAQWVLFFGWIFHAGRLETELGEEPLVLAAVVSVGLEQVKGRQTLISFHGQGDLQEHCSVISKGHVPLLEELLDGLLGIFTLGRLLEGVDSEDGLQSVQLQAVAIKSAKRNRVNDWVSSRDLQLATRSLPLLSSIHCDGRSSYRVGIKWL
jgi:hypothetical protein